MPGAQATGDRSSDLAAAKSSGISFVALVLDDCGFSIALAERVRSLDLPLTWAIIPRTPYAPQTANLLRSADVPFLVHVPMQAEGDPGRRAGPNGPYDIGLGMTERQVNSALVPLLDALPEAIGINNHRGSRATADKALMQSVMKTLADRGKIFLDSNTATKTVAYQAAQEAGLDAAKNGLFLDNEADHEKIAAEFEQLVKMARKNGSVIAICHLRPETIVFLENLAQRDLKAMGVMLVTLPEYIEIQKGD